MHAIQADRGYYELLGVERNATSEQIREAYRALARVYHPDSNFYSEIVDDSISTSQLDMFKRITAAYNILIDQEQRTQYDCVSGVHLPDWDSNDSNDDLSSVTKKQSSSYAFGTFGTARTSKRSRASHSEDMQQQQIESVAEMISFKRRFFWNLKLLFGW